MTKEKKMRDLNKAFTLMITLILATGLVLPFTGLAVAYYSPSTSCTNTEWVNPSANCGEFDDASCAYADDGCQGGYATATNGEQNQYYGYDFCIPDGSTINGIKVRLDWWLDDTYCTNFIEVQLSWDGGTSWTSPKYANTECTCDGNPTDILGSCSDTWGHDWTVDQLSDNNFRVKIICHSTYNHRDFYLDWVPVKVYYCPPTAYNLTVTAAGFGNITVSGLTGGDQIVTTGNTGLFNNVPSGTSVTLTAQAGECWQFGSWTGDVENPPNTSNPVTITMDSNKSVTGNFEHPGFYSLYVESGDGGNITVAGPGIPDGSYVPADGNGTFSVECGTDVTLEAVAGKCWQFGNWTGDVESPPNTSNPMTITVDANKSVTATFTRYQYTLTTNVAGSGSITLDPPGGTYDCGTSVEVMATSATGWGFDGWSGDLAGSLNPTTILMNANKTITANFSQVFLPPFLPSPPILASLEVTPGNASVLIGGTIQFTATGYYSNSVSIDLTGLATWNSSDTGVATVSIGNASGVGIGSAEISASCGGLADSATLNVVTSYPVVSIIVKPQSASIALGQNQQFTATATYGNGSSADVTGEAIWSSGNITVATISAGNATGVAVGTTDITATLGVITSDPATLTVGPPIITSITVTPEGGSVEVGGTQQLTATAKYSDGSTADVTNQVTWSSSDEGIASVNEGGLATGKAVGDVEVAATLNAVSGSATLTVTSPTLLSIFISPPSVSIPVNGVQQFTATGVYSDNSTGNITALATWTSSDTGIATIVGGLATGKNVGSTNIFASLDDITSNPAALSVTAAVPWWLIGGIIGGLLALGLLLFFLLRRRRHEEPVETA